MPFEPGQSGNPNGRPAGSRNLVPKKAQEFITGFLEEDQPRANQDWEKLKPYERWQVRTRLLDFVAPRLARTETSVDISRLTDEEVDRLLNSALAKLEGDE